MTPPYSEFHPSVRLALRLVSRVHVRSDDVAIAIKISETQARRLLAWMHARKLIRISYWIRKHGEPQKVYCIADGREDAYRPAPYTAAENNRRRRAGLQRNERRAPR